MELRHLRYFLAVAEEGNVTRAAERLGIAQPPLSQQIRMLEAELGIALFKRLPRGVELTSGGRMLLRDARGILSDVDLAASRAVRVAAGTEGNLVLGLTTSAAANAWVPAIIRAFHRAYPSVHLEHREGNAAQLTESVAQGAIDVGILRSPVSYPSELVFHPLLKETMLAIVPKGHRVLSGKARPVASIALRALRDDGFILVRRPGAPGMYADLLTACGMAGFAPRIAAEVDGMLTNISMVAAGLGVSVVPSSMRGFHAESVAYLGLREASQLVAPMTLVCRRAEANPASAHFVALAQTMAPRAA